MRKRRWYYMMIGLAGIWVILIQEFLLENRPKVFEKEKEQEISFVEAEEEMEPDFSEWYKNLGIVAESVPYVDVKDAPKEEGVCIGKMLPGTGIDIRKMENGYLGFEQDGEICWVKAESILTGEQAGEAAKKLSTYCGVFKQDVPVAKRPKEDAEVVYELVKGDCYPITEENEDWVRVKIRGDFGGYVKKEMVDCGYRLEEPIIYGDSMGTRTNLVNTAWNYYGGKYVWGGTTLGVGVDCSGFMLRLYELFDVKLPRVSYEQATAGVEISFSEIQPGDLIFYQVEKDRVDHVAMYTGNHKIIHAASESSGICVGNWNYLPVVCIRRYLG